MDRIEVSVIGAPDTNMAPFLARLTQRGHEISSMKDLVDLKSKGASDNLLNSLAKLKHGTIKRFDVYTVAIVGASRRFLAQIRTHQHADYVSGSLQYSDWSNHEHPEEMFVVPYELLEGGLLRTNYLDSCVESFLEYSDLVSFVGNDAAGFALPNGTRNVLVIQANAQQWQYMIGLRTCRRNSLETRYVMLKIWEELLMLDPHMFTPEAAGCGCQTGICTEGHFCCGSPLWPAMAPTEILKADFPLLMEDK